MQSSEHQTPLIAKPSVPLATILAVLVGFPAVSALVSTLLLDQSLFEATGLAFREVFWPICTVWYCLQILILSKVLKTVGWGWRDIGFGLNRRKTLYFVSGYLVFACALFGFIEFALASNGSATPSSLSDFANVGPVTTVERALFILMGLMAAICEELVYRGFAINAMRSRGLGKWLAVPVAAIPFVFQHGLKSLDQFWWFFGMGIVFGLMFVFIRNLYLNIVLHWLIILSAMLAILQAIG